MRVYLESSRNGEKGWPLREREREVMDEGRKERATQGGHNDRLMKLEREAGGNIGAGGLGGSGPSACLTLV